MFTARYGLGAYIKQTRLKLKLSILNFTFHYKCLKLIILIRNYDYS